MAPHQVVLVDPTVSAPFSAPSGTFKPTAATRAVLGAIENHEAARKYLHGVGVDWGCGVGPLGIASVQKYSDSVARVAALDVTAANVTQAEVNFRAAGLPEETIRSFLSDSFSSVIDPCTGEWGEAGRFLFGQDTGVPELDFVLANPPASVGEGLEWRRRVLREAAPLLKVGGAVFLQISFQYSLDRIKLLAERDAPDFQFCGLLASTPWVPFDQSRDDLRQQLRDYALEEERGGLPYTFRHPTEEGKVLTAVEALQEYEQTGNSPLSKWQCYLFEKVPPGWNSTAGLVSTRNGNLVSMDRGLLSGYDPENSGEGGMLLPEIICRLAVQRGKSGSSRLDPWAGWKCWSDFSFHQLAAEIVWPCLRDHTKSFVSKRELASVMKSIYTSGTFDTPEIVPVADVRSSGCWVAELFHGPTLSFKDYALQPTCAILDRILARHKMHAECVVGTSGDTGSAAIEAMRNVKRGHLAVLLPGGSRISRLQRLQMTTAASPNAMSFSFEGGTSDSIDEVVLQLFRERQGRGLCSINSINPLRIMNQMTVFFWTYFRTRERLSCSEAEWPHLSFVLPSGALGNAVAGYSALLAGLPIKELVLATNDNDCVTRWVNSQDGVFRVRESQGTTSPAIDISYPYNIERLLFLLEAESASSHDPSCDAFVVAGARVQSMMNSMRERHFFECSARVMELLAKVFRSNSASEQLVDETIRRVKRDSDYLLDTHTAVAVAAVANLEMSPNRVVVFATAHPLKDSEAVSQALQVAQYPGDIPAVAARVLSPSAVEEFIDIDGSSPVADQSNIVSNWLDTQKSKL